MKRLVHAIRRSLFARLVAIFIAATLGIGIVLEVAEELTEQHRPFQRLFVAHLSQYIDYLVADIGATPDVERALQLSESVPLDIRIEGPDISWSSHAAFPPLAELEFDHLGRTRTWRGGGPRHYVRRHSGDYSIVFATPPLDYRFQRGPRAWLSLGGVALVLLLAYLAVRRLFSPIKALHDGVTRIGAGELDYRVPGRRRDELGELTDAVNQMAGDVQDMLESKRQLLFAISHELRSPLTRARLALELMETNEAQLAIDDLDEIEHIISELLESERLGTRHAVLLREPCKLDQLIKSLVHEQFEQQSARIELVIEGHIPQVELDHARMRVLVRNLLDNALHYGGEQPVMIRLRATTETIELEVHDSGPGIPAAHLERVTEPFYRVDPSRQRKTGGLGLGLYLCKRIAIAHGGTLALSSAPGSGTTVSVTIPIASSAPPHSPAR